MLKVNKKLLISLSLSVGVSKSGDAESSGKRGDLFAKLRDFLIGQKSLLEIDELLADSGLNALADLDGSDAKVGHASHLLLVHAAGGQGTRAQSDTARVDGAIWKN